MLYERVARCTAASGDVIDHAGRNAGLDQRLDQTVGTERSQRSRLDHYRIAGDDRGGHLPSRDRARKIPGSDQPDHAERFAHRVAEDVRPLRWDMVTERACAFAAEVAKDVDGAFDLAFGRRIAGRLDLLCSRRLKMSQDFIDVGRINVGEGLLRLALNPFAADQISINFWHRTSLRDIGWKSVEGTSGNVPGLGVPSVAGKARLFTMVL